MKIFLSLPMTDYTDNEIKASIKGMEDYIHTKLGITDAEIVNNYECPSIEGTDLENRLYKLGVAIQVIGSCNLVVFHPNAEGSLGCDMEHNVCVEYNIPYIVMDDTDYRFIDDAYDELFSRAEEALCS